MPDTTANPIRVLFCIGVSQNFFDLPRDQTKPVWEGFQAMMTSLGELPGMHILGAIDDDRVMVGPSTSWPWTVYIMADVPDYDTVVAACNLMRTTPVGEHNLWRYGRIEARMGRAFEIPAWVKQPAEKKGE